MKALMIAVLTSLAVFPIACGNQGEGQQLHGPGYDISESAYRDAIRSVLAAPEGALICQMVEGMTWEEAFGTGTPEARTLQELQSELAGTVVPSPTVEVPPGGTPAPGQLGDPDDLARAWAIFQEECDRIAH
jgi:hypothetical protein